MRLDIGRITNPNGLHAILVDFLTDVGMVRAAIIALTAKLDTDGDVGTTTYNAENPAALTTLVGDAKITGSGV